MEGTQPRRSFGARRSQAASCPCLAAAAAVRPLRAAGPATGEGSHVVRPADRRALVLPGAGPLGAASCPAGTAWPLFKAAGGQKKCPRGAAAADGRHGTPTGFRKGAARVAPAARTRGNKGNGGRMECGAEVQILVRQKHEEVTARAAGARHPQGGGFGRDPRARRRLVQPLAASCAAAKPPPHAGERAHGPRT